MIDLRNITEIYVYNQKTDLRMGINGLSILAQKLVSLSELEHKIIVFYGSSNKSVKILELDGDGGGCIKNVYLAEGLFFLLKPIIQNLR